MAAVLEDIAVRCTLIKKKAAGSASQSPPPSSEAYVKGIIDGLFGIELTPHGLDESGVLLANREIYHEGKLVGTGYRTKLYLKPSLAFL